MTNYLSHADTNKLIRKALKEAFPGVTFSVRKSGGSTYVRWTDGPVPSDVDSVVKTFEGATFDSMTDYKGGRVVSMDGEEVHFGADFIFTSRQFSERFETDCRDRFSAMTDAEQAAITVRQPHLDKAEAWLALARKTGTCEAQPSPTVAGIETVRTY